MEAKQVAARRRISRAGKMNVLKQHLKAKKSVSEVCAENAIAPSQFYKWQEELFENGEVVFSGAAVDQVNKKLLAEIDELKRQLAYKTQVMFELMEEHVKTKKKLGMS